MPQEGLPKLALRIPTGIPIGAAMVVEDAGEDLRRNIT